MALGMLERVQTQPDSVATEASPLVAQFLTSLQQGKADEAWDGILANSPLKAQTSGVEESWPTRSPFTTRRTRTGR